MSTMPCPWIRIGWSLAASSWTSSTRRTRRPFAAPRVPVAVARKVAARCTKGRPCMRCVFSDLITAPKADRRHPSLPCQLRTAALDSRRAAARPEVIRSDSSNEWRMVMNKLFRGILAVAVCAASLSASIAQSQDKWDSAPWIEGKPITLKAGYNTVRQYPHARAIERFVNRVAERTGENLQIQTFPSEQAGNERQMLDAIILGNLDIAKVSTGVISTVVPEFGVFDLPYVFRDLNHMMATIKSKVGQDLVAKLEARNV